MKTYLIHAIALVISLRVLGNPNASNLVVSREIYAGLQSDDAATRELALAQLPALWAVIASDPEGFSNCVEVVAKELKSNNPRIIDAALQAIDGAIIINAQSPELRILARNHLEKWKRALTQMPKDPKGKFNTPPEALLRAINRQLEKRVHK